jgi:hypothetical protein
MWYQQVNYEDDEIYEGKKNTYGLIGEEKCCLGFNV